MTRRRTPEAHRARASRRAVEREAARREAAADRRERAPALPRPPDARGPGRERALQLAAVAALAFGVYANTLGNGFVNDDENLILLNPWIESWRALPEIFSGTAWGFTSGGRIADYYRPLMHVVYLLVHSLFGFRAWAYHLVNVLLHVGVTLLVCLLVERIVHPLREAEPPGGGSRFAAWTSVPFVAALLFAVHPIHTEVVAWIASIPELTFTPLFLLAFLLHLSPQGDRFGHRLLAAACFGLALLCKETALVLPALLALHDLALRPRRSSARELAARLAPYLIVAAAYLPLRYQALSGAMVHSASSWNLGFGQLAATLPALFAKYLALLIAPIRLAFWRPFHPLASLATTEGLTALVVTAGFVAASAWAWRRNRLVFFALAAIVVPLAPVFYIDAFPRTPIAERYLYLPSLGFVILVALGVRRLAGVARARPVALSALTILTLAWATGTVVRNRAWHDSYTLFKDSVAKEPDTPRPPLSLAAALVARGRADEATALYRILVEDRPQSADYHGAYGEALIRLGRDDAAERELRIALGLDPASSTTLTNLALVLQRRGQRDEAIALYRQAIAADAKAPEAHFNLAGALADAGDVAGALDHYQRASRFAAENPYYHSVLAIELAKQGRLKEALPHFEEAVRLAPAEPAYKKNLERARTLVSSGASSGQPPQG